MCNVLLGHKLKIKTFATFNLMANNFLYILKLLKKITVDKKKIEIED